MDDELMEAITQHRERFGEFNVTVFGGNWSIPERKQMLLDAIEQAIERGTPITDADIGVVLNPEINI